MIYFRQVLIALFLLTPSLYAESIVQLRDMMLSNPGNQITIRTTEASFLVEPGSTSSQFLFGGSDQQASVTLAGLGNSPLNVGSTGIGISIGAGPATQVQPNGLPGNVSAVPEPSTIILVGTGFVALASLKYVRRKRVLERR